MPEIRPAQFEMFLYRLNNELILPNVKMFAFQLAEWSEANS